MSEWARHLRVLLGTYGGLLTIAIVLIAIANPYGNLAFAPLGAHVIMDDNQRFQYPAIVRSGRYDSLVIGTSTARLLEPRELERHFGGRFANLALNSGTPWEQWQLVGLFRRTVAKRGMLLIGLDHVWCDPEADVRRITPRGFPEWIYDDNPWNDIAYMLNTRAIELAGRRIWHALGRVKARWPENGYEVFVPPESQFDLARVRHNIWGERGPRPIEAEVPPFAAAPEARASWRLPALPWLDDILAAKQDWQRVVLVFTPIHVAWLPRPHSEAAAREADCKARIRQLASRHGVPHVDFRIASPLTTRDENYWDPLHFRVPVATSIVENLAQALTTGRDDPDGLYLVAAPAARQ